MAFISLDELESQLRTIIRRYPSDTLLLEIHNLSKKYLGTQNAIDHQFLPQTAATLASMVVRWGNPHRNNATNQPDFDLLISLVNQYIGRDAVMDSMETNHGQIPMQQISHFLFRAGLSQFPFQKSATTSLCRSVLLYEVAAQRASRRKLFPQYDFSNRFLTRTGVTLRDFLSVCAIAWTASIGNTNGFTSGYFQKAREEGIKIPKEDIVLKVLEAISADPQKFRDSADKMRYPDRNLSNYDFNPLLIYPIIRPWSKSSSLRDRMIAPVPHLILYRVNEGIFYDLLTQDETKFTDWFGIVFEEYIGLLLQASFPNAKIYSEEQIKEHNSKYQGDMVDWVVCLPSKVLLFECKISGLHKTTIESNCNDEVNSNLEPYIIGAEQLSQFKEAILSGKVSLPDLSSGVPIISSLITYRYFFFLNAPIGSGIFKSFFPNLSCFVKPDLLFTHEDIESMQPRLANGDEYPISRDSLLSQEISDEWTNSDFVKAHTMQFLEDILPANR